MSRAELIEETEKELRRLLHDDDLVVDWIDDAYANEIEATTGDAEMLDETESTVEYEPEGAAHPEDVRLNSFYCRRPVYEGLWLYYYAGCSGVYSRIRRNRIRDIVWIGYCGVPTRKYKVFFV